MRAFHTFLLVKVAKAGFAQRVVDLVALDGLTVQRSAHGNFGYNVPWAHPVATHVAMHGAFKAQPLVAFPAIGATHAAKNLGANSTLAAPR